MTQLTQLAKNYPITLNDEDRRKLLFALGISRGKQGFTQEEAMKLLKWAEWSALNWHLLELVQRGLALPDMENTNEESFDDMLFQSTVAKLGVAALEQYQKRLKLSDEKEGSA